MSNIRYRKLVKDFHKSEEGVLQWVVVSGNNIRTNKRGYLERNLMKTLRHIVRKFLVKKSEKVNDPNRLKISPYGPGMADK